MLLYVSEIYFSFTLLVLELNICTKILLRRTMRLHGERRATLADGWSRAGGETCDVLQQRESDGGQRGEKKPTQAMIK